jgi:hypothetical protein
MRIPAKLFPWLIIVVLLGLLVLQRECQHCPDTPSALLHTDTIRMPGDTILYPYLVQVPTPYYLDTTPHIPLQVDTAAIIASFFTPVYYQDTFVNDTSYRLVLAEIVNQNRIQDRKLWVQNLRGKEYITTTQTIYQKETPRTKVYLGVSVGRWIDQFALGGSLAINTKKDHLYSLSYDCLNNSIYINSFWKIRFGKGRK